MKENKQNICPDASYFKEERAREKVSSAITNPWRGWGVPLRKTTVCSRFPAVTPLFCLILLVWFGVGFFSPVHAPKCPRKQKKYFVYHFPP